MRTARLASLLALAAGLALIGAAAVQGDLSVHLLVVIPIVSGTGPYAALGMLLAMGGLVGWLFTGVRARPGRAGPEGAKGRASTGAPQARDPAEGDEGDAQSTSTRGGGVILLGPIPIAWGSDRQSLIGVLVAAVVLILVALGAVYLLQP